jgi:hypothetical protein
MPLLHELLHETARKPPEFSAIAAKEAPSDLKSPTSSLLLTTKLLPPLTLSTSNSMVPLI